MVSNINLSSSDLLILDWIGYTTGIIKLCIDTITKLKIGNNEYEVR